MRGADRLARIEQEALCRLDQSRLVDDLRTLIRVQSITGDERAAIECLAELCHEHGLTTTVLKHDLEQLRRHPDYPGEEADRTELLGLRASLSGGLTRRLCLAGHVDVVGPGDGNWQQGPWSGRLVNGCVHGRGAVDMKGGVVAAVNAMAAVRGACPEESALCEVVLMGVSSEEDGGLGAFAALEEDDHFDACLIPEPTDFRVIATHAGALTFEGVITGSAAHAAFRLVGTSAIDRYVPVHSALANLERALNRDVADPLMAELELPYPLSVGQVTAGTWSSLVPDRLEFRGRVGIPVGTDAAEVRRLVEHAVVEAAGPGEPPEVRWIGGQFAPGATPVDHPFTQLVSRALGAELLPAQEVAQLAGISYGSDMRLFTERGIPCVMAGPAEVRLAHATDERIQVEDLVRAARMIIRTITAFARTG